MGIFNFLAPKKNTPNLSRIHSTLDELKSDRISLLIQHPGHDNYHYGLITDIMTDKNLMLVIDMTPDVEIAHWEKSTSLDFSSSPRKGMNYKFIAQFHSINDHDRKQYVIRFPQQIQVVEMRQFRRVKVGAGRNINATLMVENNVKIESQGLESLLPEKCSYDSYLFDVSQHGLQIILKGNHLDVFKKAMKIAVDISAEKLSLEMLFDIEIRWSFFDASADITRVGGNFHSLDAAQREALGHLISSIQSSLYHCYI